MSTYPNNVEVTVGDDEIESASESLDIFSLFVEKLVNECKKQILL